MKSDGFSVYNEAREKRAEDAIIRASNKACITKSDLSDAFKENGLLGVYNLGMMHMYEYLKEENYELEILLSALQKNQE